MSVLEQLTFRAPRLDEAAAIAEVANADARRNWNADDTDAAELVTDWTSPGTDLERDAVLAVAPDGAFVGYGSFHDVGRQHRQFWVWIRTASPDPVLGAELMRRLESRVEELAEAGAVLRTSVNEPDLDRRRMVTDELGYRPVRYAFRMEIALDDEPPEPAWPDGIVVRTFVRGE